MVVILKMNKFPATFLSFLGQLSITPTLVDDKPNAIVIHIGTNDILNHINHGIIAHSIINIRLDRKNNGVNEVLILSILVKENPNLTAILRQVNDMLRDLCEKNGFSFICNDVITTNYLWKIYGKTLFTCRTWEHIF